MTVKVIYKTANMLRTVHKKKQKLDSFTVLKEKKYCLYISVLEYVSNEFLVDVRHGLFCVDFIPSKDVTKYRI